MYEGFPGDFGSDFWTLKVLSPAFPDIFFLINCFVIPLVIIVSIITNSFNLHKWYL